MAYETEEKLIVIKPQTDPVDVHIGNYLKKRRTFLGITQQELARSLKISFQQVQKYEKGLNSISCKRLLELSMVLSVPVQYFYENMKEYKHTSYIGLAEKHPDYVHADDKAEVEELVNSFSTISQPEVRQQILNLVRTLAENQVSASQKKQRRKNIKSV